MLADPLLRLAALATSEATNMAGGEAATGNVAPAQSRIRGLSPGSVA